MTKPIKKAPNAKPAYMTFGRDGEGARTVTQAWTNRAWTTDGENEARATKVRWWCKLFCSERGKKQANGKYKWSDKSFAKQGEIPIADRTYVTNNLSSFKPTGKTTTYTRSSFYPLNATRKLKSVRGTIVYINSVGKGASISKDLTFKVPRKPSMSAFTYDPETRGVSLTVTTNAGNDLYERYDTYMERRSYNSRTKVSTNEASTTTATTYTLSRQFAGVDELTYGQYIKVRFVAYARGYAGDSEKVERVYYIAYPNMPTISAIVCDSTASYGLIHVKFKSNTKTEHPIDGVKLEALINTDISTAAGARASTDWETINTDDRYCTAMTARVADCQPDVGKHTWFRIKAWHGSEDSLYRYSDPKEATDLYTAAPTPPTAEDDYAYILEISEMSGECGIKLLIGWDTLGTDDSTGTEVSWARSKFAWKSNVAPDSMTFTWSDGQIRHAYGNVSNKLFRGSATIYLQNLEEGETYHVKVRRYREDDDGTTYGPYFEKTMSMTATDETKTLSVSMAVPEYVRYGKALRVSWEYDGDEDAKQTDWQLITGTVTNSTDEYGNVTHHISSNSQLVLASGKGQKQVQSIGKDIIATYANTGYVWVAAKVKASGKWVTSQAEQVDIVRVPTASLTVSDVTAQPLVAVIGSTSNQCSIAITVTADGCTGDSDIAIADQLQGDAVWTSIIDAEWTTSGSAYTTTVTAPQELDLRDGASYHVSVTLTDDRSGLKSGTVEGSVKVDYTNKAKTPSPEITVTPHDETDSAGFRRRYAVIALAAPTSPRTTDVYDLYRVSADGPQPIASGLSQTDTVIDEFAPFGDAELAYRVCSRTVDGALEWYEYPYEFGARGVTGKEEIRIDFGRSYFEGERGITLQSEWSKDFGTDSDLAGNVEGHWGYSVTRTAMGSGQLVKVYEQEQITALRELARYVGPVFVRTSLGEAYAANVDVSPLGTTLNNAGQAYSLQMTQISMPEEFGAQQTEFEVDDD